MPDYKGMRDWWAEHTFQTPTSRRPPRGWRITSEDYFPIPLPHNLAVPLSGYCLAWRWGLNGRGYGQIAGHLAHRFAFAESRERNISEIGDVLHLCHRPFCIQPSHIYEGADRDNAADRKASRTGRYETWGQIEDRWFDELAPYTWPAEVVQIRPPFVLPQKECPHEFIREAGDSKMCLNCNMTFNLRMLTHGHRPQCGFNYLCACLPCICKNCLSVPLGKAQRAAEVIDGLSGPLFNEIQALLAEPQPDLTLDQVAFIRREYRYHLDVEQITSDL